jgi:ribosomal protein S18 acetylase RimI-like enzyme
VQGFAMIKFSVMDIAEKVAVIALWEKCGLTRPWNDPMKDIDFAIMGESSTVLVGKINNQIVASAMVGHDGHRGALYYVAVDPAHRKQKIGAALMQAAEDWLKSHGVWKINIMIREDNLDAIGFYKALGYEMNAVVSLGKKIS